MIFRHFLIKTLQSHWIHKQILEKWSKNDSFSIKRIWSNSSKWSEQNNLKNKTKFANFKLIIDNKVKLCQVFICTTSSNLLYLNYFQLASIINSYKFELKFWFMDFVYCTHLLLNAWYYLFSWPMDDLTEINQSISSESTKS